MPRNSTQKSREEVAGYHGLRHLCTMSTVVEHFIFFFALFILRNEFGFYLQGPMDPFTIRPEVQIMATEPEATEQPVQPMQPRIVYPPVPDEIPPGTPQGLEFLLLTDKIIFQQDVNFVPVMGLMGGVSTLNQFNVMDGFGRRIYHCAGDTMGSIKAFDCIGQNIMRGHYSPTPMVYICCGNEVRVSDVSGGIIGSAVQTCTCSTFNCSILDSTGEPVLCVEGPPGCCLVLCNAFSKKGEADFPVTTLKGTQVGKIRKHYSGKARVHADSLDKFTTEYPVDLDVKIKATLLYTTFLIDHMFYKEESHQVPNRDYH